MLVLHYNDLTQEAKQRFDEYIDDVLLKKFKSRNSEGTFEEFKTQNRENTIEFLLQTDGDYKIVFGQ